MPEHSRSNLYLGLICVVAAVLLMAVWIPLDTKTGIVEKVRGRFVIGDALAPMVAACFILLGGVILVIKERAVPDQQGIGRREVVFAASLLSITIVSFLVMRFAGPVLAELVNLFRETPVEYRLLRATPGWKHVGFALGGVMMVTGIISVVERRVSRRAVLTALFAVAVMIAVFDLPFEDLLLPPNGDV